LPGKRLKTLSGAYIYNIDSRLTLVAVIRTEAARRILAQRNFVVFVSEVLNFVAQQKSKDCRFSEPIIFVNIV
jgi:hypothetical protein